MIRLRNRLRTHQFVDMKVVLVGHNLLVLYPIKLKVTHEHTTQHNGDIPAVSNNPRVYGSPPIITVTA